jgi:hypothetical protein
MASHRKTAGSGIIGSRDPKDLENLCADLSRAGQANLQRIARTLGEFAPRPGFIVYLRAKPLTFRLNGLEPVVFSAIDYSTHLQLAQAYHSMTTAAAVLFVEYVTQNFPFRISQIKTPAERPFNNTAIHEPHRDFTAIIGERGLVHTLIEDPSRDPLASITSGLMFGGISEGTIGHLSTQELQRTLTDFIFSHNNFRYIPWLGGKTPLQKLKTFEGFSAIDTFTPYPDREPMLNRQQGRPEGTNVLRDHAIPTS